MKGDISEDKEINSKEIKKQLKEEKKQKKENKKQPDVNKEIQENNEIKEENIEKIEEKIPEPKRIKIPLVGFVLFILILIGIISVTVFWIIQNS